MRALAGLRVSHVPSTFRLSTTRTTLSPSLSTSATSSRHYSSLRPLLLTHHTTPSQRRPTPHHLSKPPSHHLQSRPFSLAPLLETAVTASQTVLTTLHSTTGLPWYLTIPLFALTINLVSRFPGTLYSQRVAIRRAKLNPLVSAWGARAARDVSPAGQQQPMEYRKWMRQYVKANEAETRKRNKRWGVQTWKSWVPWVMVFPVWVSGIEALRRMCGGPMGLLGRFKGGVEWAEGKVNGEEVVEGVKGAQDAVVGTGGGAGADSVSTSLATEVQEVLASSGADPSMATGGCLWFPDLMAADPTHILPYALSAILVLNLMPKTQLGLRSLFGLSDQPGVVVMKSRMRLAVQRAFLIFAVAIGPLTMDLPAALHIYWISSATLTGLQTAVISRLMPLPKPVPKASKTENMFVMPTRNEKKRLRWRLARYGIYE